MGLNLNNVYQRPYVMKDGRNFVKQKQDEESSAAQTQREEQTDQNAKSKGLQYTEQNKTAAYTSGYQPQTGIAAPEKSWQETRAQIQNQANSSYNKSVTTDSTNSPSRSSNINIAQVLKDFKNTAVAIGTPAELNEEVSGYLSLIESQVQKADPNVRLVKSNLKNAASILDNFISETLNKTSKVVENWVDALFLQQIDFKYNEGDINTQFLVKFPEGSTTPKTEQSAAQTAIPTEQSAETMQTNSLVPQDKELKSAFINAKKLAYADKPKEAIVAFQSALARAEEIGDIETQSKIYFEVGKIYDDYDYIPQALTSYNNSIQTTKDSNVKTKAHFSMAQIYDDVNYITPALDHYFNSISFGGEAENLVAQSTSLVKIGNIYTDMFEDPMDYYLTANDLAEQTDNPKIKGYVSSGLANAYEKFGEPQEALKSYSSAVKYYTDADSPSKVAQNYISAAEIMLDYNNSAKAKGLLQKAQAFAGKTDDINLMSEISKKINELSV